MNEALEIAESRQFPSPVKYDVKVETEPVPVPTVVYEAPSLKLEPPPPKPEAIEEPPKPQPPAKPTLKLQFAKTKDAKKEEWVSPQTC